MIVATPLDIPPILPDDWSVFWDIWKNHAGPIVKVSNSHKQSYAAIGDDYIWKGLEIYNKTRFRPAWTAPFYNIQEQLPNMYNMLEKHSPYMFTGCVRIIESLCNISAHTDDNMDKWNVRALLHCTDPDPQWYFTKPTENGERTFLHMPKETNWFSYNDKHCWHGSMYNTQYPKLLIQIYGFGFKDKELIKNSIEKYKDYTVSYD